jgi:hypothetical protein
MQSIECEKQDNSEWKKSHVRMFRQHSFEFSLFEKKTPPSKSADLRFTVVLRRVFTGKSFAKIARELGTVSETSARNYYSQWCSLNHVYPRTEIFGRRQRQDAWLQATTKTIRRLVDLVVAFPQLTVREYVIKYINKYKQPMTVRVLQAAFEV